MEIKKINDALFIDEICNMIKQNCSDTDLIRFVNMY